MCRFLPCRSTAALGAALEAGEISQGPHVRACLPMVNSPCFFASTAVCTLAIGPCIQFTPVHWHITCVTLPSCSHTLLPMSHSVSSPCKYYKNSNLISSCRSTTSLIPPCPHHPCWLWPIFSRCRRSLCIPHKYPELILPDTT